MPSPQSSHTLGLYARHPQEILEICEIGGQGCELGVEVRLFVYRELFSLPLFWFWGKVERGGVGNEEEVG